MQPPNSSMASSPRKIGSALAAFENTINKNIVNDGPGTQSVLKDAAASPRIVPSWKKNYRCSTPGASTKDSIDLSDAFATPSVSIKKRMEAFASVNKLPFSESEDTADTAEANSAQVAGDPPAKDSETRFPHDTNRESQTSDKSDKKGVNRQNSLVELAPPRLSSVKYLRTNSVKSTDAVTDIASILDPFPFIPTRSRQQSESWITPTKKVMRWKVGQTVQCANDADAEVKKAKESPRLTKEKQQSEFQSDREGGFDISLGSLPALEPLQSDSFESLPEEPLPRSPKESKRKNTHVIRIHKGQVRRGQVCHSRPSSSVSGRLTPPEIPSTGRKSTSSRHPSRHRSGAHSLSPTKTSKGNVGASRYILKCGNIPSERFEEQSREIELDTKQRSSRSLRKPGKSSLSRGTSKFLCVTFADGVVEPRREPRRNSMICITADKDTLPKQPRRHSMSDVEEIRRKSKRLRDPALHRRRFCRAAVKIQDFIQRMLRRLRFVKIIAATRIQALYRGVMQRMHHRLAMLEQRLGIIEATHKRQVDRLQTQKWKMMEAFRHNAEEEIKEHDAATTAIVKVANDLRRENSKLRDQNSNIRDASSLLREINGQIEITLQIHNENFATMHEAMRVLSERNVRAIRMSKKYEMRSEKVKREMLTAEKYGVYESNFRKELEKTTADIASRLGSLLTGDKELADTITALRLSAVTQAKDV